MALGKWFSGNTASDTKWNGVVPQQEQLTGPEEEQITSIQYGTSYSEEDQLAFFEYLADKDSATRQEAFKGVEQYYQPYSGSEYAQQLKEESMAQGYSEKAAEARVEWKAAAEVFALTAQA